MKLRFLTSLVAITLALVSCTQSYEKTLKSTDPAEIIEEVKYWYEKGNMVKAITLLDYGKKLAYGTDYADEFDYYSALAHYKDKNYPLAAALFKQYSSRYKDSLTEDTHYLSAYCYYLGSMPHNLDQTSSKSAIEELQAFIDKYPDSEKVAESNQFIDELLKRQEKKAFENAKTLFKITRYPSASLAFDNVIDDFPDSNFKEESYWYSFQSKAIYAFNSYDYLKEERFKNAETTYKLFKKYYPDSQYMDEADKLMEKINKEREELKTQEGKDAAEREKNKATKKEQKELEQNSINY